MDFIRNATEVLFFLLMLFAVAWTAILVVALYDDRQMKTGKKVTCARIIGQDRSDGQPLVCGRPAVKGTRTCVLHTTRTPLHDDN